MQESNNASFKSSSKILSSSYDPWLSTAVRIHHDQKPLNEERRCFILQFSDPTPSAREVKIGTQGRNLENITEAEATLNVEHCLVECVPC